MDSLALPQVNLSMKYQMADGALKTAPAHQADLTRPGSDKSRSNPHTNTALQSKSSDKTYDHREVARKLKNDYAHGARDPGIRHLDTLHSLVKYLIKVDLNLDEMLRQTALSIYTQFSIKEG